MSKYKLDKSAQVVDDTNYTMTQEEVCERLNNQSQQIADLEAKLAEKDAELKNIVEGLWTRKWANKYYEMRRKEQPKLLFPDSDEVYERYFELKQQLAEKEKELKYKTAECEKWQRDYENCSRLEKLMTKEHQYCLDNWRASEQDKISFAVEHLEKVLVLIQNAVNLKSPEYDLVGLYDAVSDQIKQLKEMM